MIARIAGTVEEVFERGVVIDCGAIGYSIYTPDTFSVGEGVLLYTHLVIRDDAHELYGFRMPDEKRLFLALISVSGVGPKMALSMLIMYPLADLVYAIKNGDAKAISLVPGLGKKTAEKIIIDLKDKLDGYALEGGISSNDLVEALLSLGFKEYDIKVVLPAIDPSLVLEQQITAALQLLKK